MPDVADAEPEVLTAALDRLLPRNEELPPAGQMGLARAVLDDAATSPPLAAALATVMQRLPESFGELNWEAQDEALRAVEATQPRAFAGLINLAYTAYYTDARVLGFIARRTGYEPRPPQPKGYQLTAFDDRLLEKASRRAALWRKVD